MFYWKSILNSIINSSWYFFQKRMNIHFRIKLSNNQKIILCDIREKNNFKMKNKSYIDFSRLIRNKKNIRIKFEFNIFLKILGWNRKFLIWNNIQKIFSRKIIILFLLIQTLKKYISFFILNLKNDNFIILKNFNSSICQKDQNFLFFIFFNVKNKFQIYISLSKIIHNNMYNFHYFSRYEKYQMKNYYSLSQIFFLHHNSYINYFLTTNKSKIK